MKSENETETDDLVFCGECRDFLYEDYSGYGICTQDNDRHSCNARCIFGNTRQRLHQKE